MLIELYVIKAIQPRIFLQYSVGMTGFQCKQMSNYVGKTENTESVWRKGGKKLDRSSC